MKPQDSFYINAKRLELAEANTADVLERFDNSNYHCLTWVHHINCDGCGITEVMSDTPKNGREDIEVAMCPECKRLASLTPFVEVAEYDEGYAW